ncbi:hypothetical protein BT96DRAFT_943344 [Gymnopus androsaceus JB14]|uniref:Uncharacterized protein n=1 Tax=Gymnopus androsaceus JB14 TaxID=1447944 RepID=A0A6A4H7I6_9AGAR|nr:hypothetical protein BT96DRAFT_943344 [Gymnopus androsaceus JB14]
MDANDKGTLSLHACNLEAAANVVLTRFFAAQQPTDSPQAPSHTGCKKKTKNLKVGSTGYYKQVKKVVLEKLSPEISQELMHAQATDYKDDDGPGPNGFQLYFGDGWWKSRWNRMAMKNMMEFFLTQEGDRVETSEEARAHAQEYNKRWARDVRLTVRKSNKFDWCKQDVDKLLADTSCSAVDKKKWQRVRNILLKLQTQGQSSKDTDNEDGGLVITQPYYQCCLITEMLEDLDQNIKELEMRQKAASDLAPHVIDSLDINKKEIQNFDQ